MTHSKNEIDLIELSIKIFIYLKKYFWIFALAIILGIAYSMITAKSVIFYESEMLIKTRSENNFMYAVTLKELNTNIEENPGELIVKIIESLNKNIENKNIELLEQKTGLNEKQLKQITSIEAFHQYIKGEAVSNFVTVKVTGRNIDAFSGLSGGIIKYINTNSYILEKRKNDSLFLADIIQKLNLKIAELDKLQENFIKNNSINNIETYKDNSFFTENIMLSSLKEKLIYEQSQLNQTELIEDFFLPVEKTNASKKSILINVFIFLFLSFIVVFFLILNKKAKEYQKN
jgi:hypothetical protein